jgi:hypothetical protein
MGSEICGTHCLPSVAASARLRGCLILINISTLRRPRMGPPVRARVGWAQTSASFVWTPPELRNNIRQLASHELKLLEHGLSVGPQMLRAGHYPIP